MSEASIPTCREMAEMVTDFLEGALSFSRRTAARLHLRFCPACARYFDQMRRTARLVADAPPPSPPDEAVVERIMTRHHAQPRDAGAEPDRPGWDPAGRNRRGG